MNSMKYYFASEIVDSSITVSIAAQEKLEHLTQIFSLLMATG